MAELRVFLIEDNQADIVLMHEALANGGVVCEMLVAEDGHKALSILERLGRELPCPDIAIIDLNVPKVGGVELLRELRLHSACADIPVLVTTSSQSPRDLEIIEKLGAAYFHKPIDLNEYFKIAEAVMNLVRAGQPDEAAARSAVTS
jgi:CheY-like chemotaxis protein